MSEHRIPREINHSPPPEAFQINDPEIGKTFAVRELTDEQLQRFMDNAVGQQKALIQQSLALIGQATQAAAMASVLGYELDRRRRSITLATGADLSNLRRQ
jgi:hypothetical protein